MCNIRITQYPPEPIFDEPAECGRASASFTDGNGFII
jgi:hypothetical protein